MEMGNRIRQKRLEKGYTMEELGAKVGVKSSAVNKWEKGHVTNIKRSTIQQLAKILECDPVWLAGLDDGPQRKQIEAFTRNEQDAEMHEKVKAILKHPLKRKILIHIINGLYEDNEL